MSNIFHTPVLKEEVIEHLRIKEIAKERQPFVIDATIGYGGHTEKFLNLGCRVLGIDADPDAISYCRKVFNKYLADRFEEKEKGAELVLVNDNFIKIKKICDYYYYSEADAILFDLGVSTVQLTSNKRGMSFFAPDSELDMRFDQKNQGVTGADLLNFLGLSELVNLFSEVISYHESRRLSEVIIKKRKKYRFHKVSDFIDAVNRAGLIKRGNVNIMTKPLMALRIAVNSELKNLNIGIEESFKILKNKGRLGVISFHSGEDRIVKQHFVKLAENGFGEILIKKPIIPSSSEVKNNPRSRSAKFRVIQKI